MLENPSDNAIFMSGIVVGIDKTNILMSLKIVRITRDFPDMNALEQIAVEAFPPQEYVSPQDLLSYTESSDDCDFWGFYAGKDFIGYLHLIRYKNMVYVCFFAVGVSYRIR